MSSRTLLLVLLCIIAFSKAAVVSIDYYQDAPKYFPTNTFDTIISSDLRTKAFGSFKYSIATWFKISQTRYTSLGSNYAIMLHLTALNVDFPWEPSSYSDNVRNLGNLIRMRFQSGYLVTDIGTFSNYQNQYYNTHYLAPDCWHFAYVGVNHETGKYSNAVFSEGCSSSSTTFWSGSMSGTPVTNEALDDRLTLYLGGSKNHVTTVSSSYESWIGSLYRTSLLIGYFTDSSAVAQSLMGGEKKNVFYFYLDNTETQQVLPSTYDATTYLTLGADSTTETTDPTLNGVDGLLFADATSKKMFITLPTQLQDFVFVSFWVRIDNNTPSSTYHTIMSAITRGNSQVVSLLLYKWGPYLQVKVGTGTMLSEYFTITYGKWHFVYMTFNYAFVDTLGNKQVAVSMMVDSTQVMYNRRTVVSVSSDYIKPQYSIYFGKIPGSTDSVINGAIRNVIGGTGSYFSQDSTSTSCIVSVGLQSPYCLYCNPTSSLYSDTTGTCVSTCPTGTYKDTNTLTCVPCDVTCTSCTGPGPTKCATCAEDTPLYFGGRCFATCPAGTLKNALGVCDCDSSCSGCEYNTVTKGADCVGCALTTLYRVPDKSRCVLPIQCPVGTLADSSTTPQSCATTCPGGKVYDYANGKCADVCAPGTSKLAGTPVKCYSVCPDGTHSTTITPGAGETSVGCQACSNNCLTCESASKCLSCTKPNLFHEDTYKCLAACDAGFYFSQNGYFCRACQVGCTACSGSVGGSLALYAPDSTCVYDCPIGYAKSNPADQGKCIQLTTMDVTIVNKTASVPIISISRKDNLVLIGKYVTSTTLTGLQWSLDPADPTLTAEFFNNVVRTTKNLVVPSANLRAGQTYKVVFQANDVGSQDTEFVTVQTSAALTAGTLTVSPLEGTAFQTQFTFTIAGFTASGLKYDIISYFERSHVINAVTYTEKIDILTIAQGVDQGTYTYIFPISQQAKPLTIELCGYNSYEQVCVKKAITLLASGSLPLQKVLVWSADATTLVTVDRMLDFVRSISLFYTRSWENQISTEYSRGALLISNLANTQDIVACSKIAECSNAGACKSSGSSFTCDCELGFGGFNCYYGVREYAAISVRVKDILTNLHSVTLDSSNVEKAILILEELTNTLDLIDYNTIFFFKDILTNILKVQGLRKEHFRPIFNILGEVIGFIKRSLTGTWFKSTDRSLLLVSMTNLVDKAFGLIDGVKWGDSIFIVDTNFLKVMVINNFKGQFPGGSSTTQPFTINFEGFGFTFPAELMAKIPSASIKLLGYKINPYSDSQTNSQITSTMKVEVFDGSGPVTVSGLTDSIILRIPKLTATPIFPGKSNVSPYNCQFKYATDRSKITFRTTDCSFGGENTTHLTCACKHLTEFVGQLDLNNVASIPSTAAIYAVSDTYSAEQIELETEKRLYYVVPPTTPTATVVIAKTEYVIKFKFPNYGLYLAAAIAGLYILIMLFNIGNVKKNALKKFLDQGQSILVLTYHPVMSMCITAHTSTSNTQLMRVTKFFTQLEIYAGVTALFYFLLDLKLDLDGATKLIPSAIFTMIVAPWIVYFLEFIYGKFKKRKEGKRRSSLYHYGHLFFMVFWGAAAFVFVGLMQSEYQSSWVGSFFLATVLDVCVFDVFILVFAIMQKNKNTKRLKLFRSRGYYVDTGVASIITPEDEAALLAKIKKVLRSETLRELEEIPAMFAGAHRIAGEIDDLNASHVTDINELKDNKNELTPIDDGQPDQHGESMLDAVLKKDVREGQDREINQLVENIGRAAIRSPTKSTLNKQKATIPRNRSKGKGH